MTWVVRAYLWTNGQTMAFDDKGQQVPEYQGEGMVMVPKLRKDFPDLLIEGVDWATDMARIIK